MYCGNCRLFKYYREEKIIYKENDGMKGLLYISLFIAALFGAVTKEINKSKGYSGGFFTGFGLGLIGWMFGFGLGGGIVSVILFGMIGVILFACKPENSNRFDKNTSSVNPLLSGNNDFSNRNEQQLISNGGWKCYKCGRVNAVYAGTCACGVTKTENTALDKKKEKSEKELENIQKLKYYKELLDSGVITQEEFDKKKSQLLDL